MKYKEISRMEAKSIIKCGGGISIAIYSGVYGADYHKEIIIDPEDYKDITLVSLDDIETKIMTELRDNLHYTFKYYEIWE